MGHIIRRLDTLLMGVTGAAIRAEAGLVLLARGTAEAGLAIMAGVPGVAEAVISHFHLLTGSQKKSDYCCSRMFFPRIFDTLNRG
jgi:hypothetical protein